MLNYGAGYPGMYGGGYGGYGGMGGFGGYPSPFMGYGGAYGGNPYTALAAMFGGYGGMGGYGGGYSGGYGNGVYGGGMPPRSFEPAMQTNMDMLRQFRAAQGGGQQPTPFGPPFQQLAQLARPQPSTMAPPAMMPLRPPAGFSPGGAGWQGIMRPSPALAQGPASLGTSSSQDQVPMPYSLASTPQRPAGW